MNTSTTPNPELELRLSRRLLDVLIRFSLVVILVSFCYQVFAPFISLMAWALILAVTLYPLQRIVVRKLRVRQGVAATMIVMAAVVMIVAPTAVLLVSFGDSVQATAQSLQGKPIEVPPPRPGVEDWPHTEELPDVDCGQCHDDVATLYAGSLHGGVTARP